MSVQWTPAMTARLRRDYGAATTAHLAAALGVTVSAVYHKAHTLGLARRQYRRRAVVDAPASRHVGCLQPLPREWVEPRIAVYMERAGKGLDLFAS